MTHGQDCGKNCRLKIHGMTGSCLGPATAGATVRVRIDATRYHWAGTQYTVYGVDECRTAEGGELRCNK